MCAVPNMAVFCSSLTSCFPGMLLTYFLHDFETVPVAPIITGITFVFTILLLLLLLLLLFTVRYSISALRSFTLALTATHTAEFPLGGPDCQAIRITSVPNESGVTEGLLQCIIHLYVDLAATTFR